MFPLIRTLQQVFPFLQRARTLSPETMLTDLSLQYSSLNQNKIEQKGDVNKTTARTEVYMCNIEENPFEKGFFLKLLS